jgi:MFS family permease
MPKRDESVRPASPLRRLPPGIWVLGFGSLFMDTSSELVHSLLPLYMSATLGASVALIGLVEGIAEATAQITKIFSGALSDFLRRRKFLVVLGYGLGALSKPVFPLANSMGWVMAARFTDRVGKGIRGAPRDALVADLVPPEQRGAAYGLRQALDSVGAFLGPILAVACMAWFAGNVKATLRIAVIPALIAVSLLAIGIREPDRDRSAADRRPAPWNAAAIRRLGLRFWMVALLGAVFSLARFSEAFLVLRAQNVGLALGRVPIVMILMNVVYAVAAYPAGAAADRLSKRSLLIAGLLVLIAADLILARAASPAPVFLGALLWGLHMALTQGLFSKLVADACPADLRGSAFGVFNLIGGLSLLAASVLAGALWERFGAGATFLAGAAFAGLGGVGLLGYRDGSRKA